MGWKPTANWNATMIAAYRLHAVKTAKSYVNKGLAATCDDLALRLLIEFASRKKLPLEILNGAYPRGELHPGAFQSVAQFRDRVLMTTGARDLGSDSLKNTLKVGKDKPGTLSALKKAQPGDLIYFKRTGNSEGYKHIQVVVENSTSTTNTFGHRIVIAQGNFRGDTNWWDVFTGNRNDPDDDVYLGAKVKLKTYVAQEEFLKASQTTRATLLNVQGYISENCVIRRWNFLRWNPNAGKGSLAVFKVIDGFTGKSYLIPAELFTAGNVTRVWDEGRLRKRYVFDRGDGRPVPFAEVAIDPTLSHSVKKTMSLPIINDYPDTVPP